MKNKWLLAIGLALSATFLFFAVKDLQFNRLWAVLLRADWYWIGPMIGAAVLFFWVKVYRWRLLLMPVKAINSRDLFPSMMVGTALNYILFGYLGEIFRMHLLSRAQHLSKSSVLATIVLERIFDLLTIIILLGITLLVAPHLSSGLENVGYLVLILGVVSLIFAVTFALWPQTGLSLCRRLTCRLPQEFAKKLIRQIELGAQGLRAIAHAELLIKIIAASLVQWCLMGLCNWFAMVAVGIDVPYSAVFATMALITLGITLPSAPGHVGVIELCYVVSLTGYGVTPDQAFAAAILFHFFLYAGVLLTGAVIFRSLGLTLQQAKQSAEASTEGKY